MKKTSLITRCVGLTLRFPKMVLCLAGLLTLLSLHYSKKINIRSNFSDLLPDTTPSVVQARALEKIVGGASFVVVTVETKNQNAAENFLTDLKTKVLEQTQDILYVDDHPPDRFLKKEGLMFLSLKDLDKLRKEINQRLEQGKLKKTRLYVDFSNDSAETQPASKETLLSPLLLQSHPLYQNAEGTLFVSLIKTSWRTTDVARTQVFVDKLQTIIAHLVPSHYDPELQVRLTGPYLKTLSQKKILIHDASLVSLVSFILAITYLMFHFRRKRSVFLITVPLTVSVLWSLAIGYLFFGSLNLFSSAACAILLGLAADYGIHIYSEYIRFRKRGISPEESLLMASDHLAKAFLAASSTTAGAFFALMFSRFKAFYELGLMTGVGVILCGIAFVLLFPPLTLLMERWKPEKIDVTEWTGVTARLSDTWTKWIFSRQNLIFSIIVLLLPVITIAFGNLKFDYNISHIMGRQESRELDKRVDGIFGHSVNPEVLLVDKTEDAGKLVSAIRDIQQKNKNSARGTTIKGALALSDFVPEHQEEKIKKIRGIKSLFTDLVIRSLSSEERKSYEQLKKMLDPHKITLQSLPLQIINKFQDREGKLGRTVFVFPNFEMSQGNKFMNYVEEIRSVQCPTCAGSFYASGESSVFYDIVQMLFKEGKYVVGFAVMMIVIALLINFRSFKSTLLICLPLTIGLCATLGFMGLFKIPFNIINLAAIPIILGTADDYAIHFYQRFVEHPFESMKEAYQITFRPILGSLSTTLIGFASLLLADMGGIRSFGTVCTLGILLCAITTLVWFPALLIRLARATAGSPCGTKPKVLN